VVDVVVPKLNNNDSSYVLTEWLLGDGAEVRCGDPVVVVETSKAAEELLSEGDGVLHHVVAVDAECRPGELIGRVFADRLSWQQFLAAGAGGETASAPGVSGVRTDAGDASPGAPDPVLTDSARELAEQLGLCAADLRTIGRPVVRREDVERLAAAGTSAPMAETGTPEDAGTPTDVTREATAGPAGDRHVLPRTQLGVAAVVSQSHRDVPAAFAAVAVDAGPALELARTLTRSTRRMIGMPELLVKTVAGLRERFPLFFATGFDGRSVRLARTADIGVTVDVGTGLFIPVVAEAEELSCAEIADTLNDYREQALRSAFAAEDLTGAAIIVSLHNEPDVTVAVPIVPPGLVCALTLTGVRTEVGLDETGRPVGRRVTTVGAAYDHRVVNGRDAVLFLQEIKSVLERPEALGGNR
jgi:2-oxoglutarate dehydrogenase E2 component (dihydrolipoamide succinyltransferase)